MPSLPFLQKNFSSPLISVCIPAYNHEQFIEECIRSIIAQSYTNLELLILDDGSTDNTYSIIQKLLPECETRFTRCWVQTWQNHGRVDTVNELIRNAQGQYCFICASDDKAKPNAIEVLEKKLRENPDCALAVGDNELIDANGIRISWNQQWQNCPFGQGMFDTFGQALRLCDSPCFKKRPSIEYMEILRANHIPNGYLIPRQALLKAGLYEHGYCFEDWYMNVQLLKQGKFIFIPEILFSYRRHKHNSVNSLEYKNKRDESYKNLFVHEHDYCVTHKLIYKWLEYAPKKAILEAITPLDILFIRYCEKSVSVFLLPHLMARLISCFMFSKKNRHHFIQKHDIKFSIFKNYSEYLKHVLAKFVLNCAGYLPAD